MTEMQERIGAALADWARRIPADQIPAVLTFLAARLLTERNANRSGESGGAQACDHEKLLTAGAIAERLGIPESWVRTEERAGRIPGVRLGRYVRFKLSEIERALGKRKREGT
jgi:excisionase family DNA binding protein